LQAVFHNNFRFLRLERYINGNKPEYAAENINHERDPVNDSPNLTFGFDKIPCGERDCNQKRKLCDKIENTRYVTQTARVQDRADYKQNCGNQDPDESAQSDQIVFCSRFTALSSAFCHSIIPSFLFYLLYHCNFIFATNIAEFFEKIF
jgi:hypothetical protein